MEKQLHYRWRYVKCAGPWKKIPGTVLTWEMTEVDAERHMQANPGTIIEKVPGSGYERQGGGGTAAWRRAR